MSWFDYLPAWGDLSWSQAGAAGAEVALQGWVWMPVTVPGAGVGPDLASGEAVGGR